MSGSKVVERRFLLTLGNILGLGQAKVLLLRAGLWVWDHLGPVNNHVLGQFTDFVDVLANSINALLLDLPVGDAIIGRILIELQKNVFLSSKLATAFESVFLFVNLKDMLKHEFIQAQP